MLPNWPLQRPWSSLTLGTTPLNGDDVGKTELTMLAGIVMIIGGAALGLVLGWYGTVGVLLILGMGNSHNDMFTAVAGAMLGSIVGAILLPVAVSWWNGRRKRKTQA